MAGSAMVSIVLAGGCSLLTDGLASLVAGTLSLAMTGQASTIQELLLLCGKSAPDVVLVDLAADVFGAWDVPHRLQQEGFRIGAVAVLGSGDSASLRRALDVGFRGVVLHSSPWDNVVRAILAVASGATYMDGFPCFPAAFDEADAGADFDDEVRLTRREEEVLRHVAHGLSLKEAASRVGINEKTAETYKARAMRKLRLTSRPKIVRYAIDHGWFRQEPLHSIATPARDHNGL